MGLVAARGDRAQAVHDAASAGRDETSHDDVLLQALQLVHLAGGRRFGQHARGLLEGGR